jgi:hypothetical protein
MNVISPDKGKLIEEQKETEKKRREDNDRSAYLERLKKDKKFKKYIVEEIFEDSLNNTFTLDKLPVSDEMDKLGAVALQYVLARQAVQKIINKLK